MHPAVLQLQIHLPNFQTIQFEEDDDLEEVLRDSRWKQTMLTGFSSTNATDNDAKKLNQLYKEFPRHYESAYKRGLLHNDDDTEPTMEEAPIYRMQWNYDDYLPHYYIIASHTTLNNYSKITMIIWRLQNQLKLSEKRHLTESARRNK
ncbi:hypothetical protein LIER_43767 [Lithospermum erythrorhizon]|uniref:Uncharacterized protein n=1 Tax=Lithospermum erythrorhizon TaxID=34254 RepID=A0AAV3QXG5_LITER